MAENAGNKVMVAGFGTREQSPRNKANSRPVDSNYNEDKPMPTFRTPGDNDEG